MGIGDRKLTVTGSHAHWKYGNLVLRASLGLFLLLWGIDKVVATEDTQKIFSHFYLTTIGTGSAKSVGVIEGVLALMIITGLLRRVTFAIGLFLHTVSTLSSWRQLLDPWGVIWNAGKNSHLFLASIPVLAAFVVLFMNRADDAFTLDRRIGIR